MAFHANCLFWVETICMTRSLLFSGKNKTFPINLLSVEFTHKLVKVKK